MESDLDVLLVEDNPGDVRLIREYLNGHFEASFDLESVSRLEEALSRVSDRAFDAMVLDLNLSDSRAQNTINRVKDLSKRVPIVVLTGTEDQELIQNALEAGAQDYLIKDELTGNLLSRSLRYAIERHRTQKQLKQSQQHYRSLFEDSPVAKFVEDFSEVKRYIDDLREGGVSDFRSYFEDHPAEVKHCSGLIRTIEANDACQQLYRAPEKSDISSCVDELYMDESWSDFRDELLRYVEGHEFYTGQTVQRAYDGGRVHVYLKSRLAPGAEEDWSRIYVSMVDITERVKAEQHLSQRTEQLNERLKELRCLQRVSRILENQSGSTPRLIQQLVEVIPTGYRYAEQISVRVTLDDVTATSPSFSPAGSAQRRDITQNGNTVGSIEVFRDPVDQASAFIDEEEDLIDEIVSRLEAVHERNRAEVNLRESEERFRQMAENIDQVFWLMTYDEYEIIYVSPAFEDVFGRPVEQLYENPDLWMESVHGEDRDDIHRRFPGDFDDVEYRVVRPDGDVRWLHEQAVPVRNDEGDLYRIAGVAEDITERKRAEVRLAESEERFRQMAENIDEVFWMFDDSFNELIYMSPQYEQLSGQSIEELEDEAQSFFEIIHPEDHSLIEEAVEKLTQGEEVLDLEHRYVHKETGRIRWMHTEGFPVTNERGEIYRITGFTKNITERKLAQSRLAESEERFRIMAENIEEVFYMHGEDFSDILYMNSAFETVWGIKREEVYEHPMKWLEFIHPEDRNEVETLLERAVERDFTEPFTFTYRVVRPEDDVRWIQATNYPILNEEGERTRIVGLAQDITERKQAEFELAESEQRFRRMAENIEGAFWIYDRGFEELIYMSPGYREVFRGIEDDPHEHPRAFLDFIHPDDRDRMREAIERIQQHGQSVDLEYRIELDSGETRWVASQASPVRNEQGEIFQIAGITRDISQRKRAEIKLAESEERFRQMAENTDEVIWLARPDLSELEYINPAFENIFGIAPESVLEDPYAFWSQVPEDEQPHVKESLEQFSHLEQGEQSDFEWRIEHPEKGVRWLWTRGFPVCNEEGEVIHVTGFTRDITELNRTMKNLERTIEEKETLLKEVHHRVRNNLQVISSLLGLQRRRTTDPALSDLLLNSKSRVHAMALIHKRLYESGTFTDINFQEYVEDLTRDIVDFNREEGLELSTRVDVEETDLDFDTIVPCGLIINELVTNSIKHAFNQDDEGTISIVFHRNEEGIYEIEASDDGSGWTAEHSFRDTPSLGLNLVVNLVENQLHGEIEQYQDGGTTYRITFPPVENRFNNGEAN